ncbi:hypothetical protein RQP54_17765 [Curvibacter sp. APW13]|uniref:hypothetical protein n=1 Tax=Curvibacter sp. APW13 TaxID=3077236 RepID=UPI0028DF5F73|nr:hypothetical protein [Curvibacter sp. APW13]MDT8992724.1 hypothetical protein [Curvibacter sp. APW13]
MESNLTKGIVVAHIPLLAFVGLLAFALRTCETPEVVAWLTSVNPWLGANSLAATRVAVVIALAAAIATTGLYVLRNVESVEQAGETANGVLNSLAGIATAVIPVVGLLSVSYLLSVGWHAGAALFK